MASTENIIERFETGATRNTAGDKFDYEGFLNPQVIEAYGEFMHENRFQRDGTVRESDNWQQGIPLDNYMKSLLRHVIELWSFHRTGQPPFDKDKGRPFTKRSLCCAIMFNAMGYLKETIAPSVVNMQRG